MTGKTRRRTTQLQCHMYTLLGPSLILLHGVSSPEGKFTKFNTYRSNRIGKDLPSIDTVNVIVSSPRFDHLVTSIVIIRAEDWWLILLLYVITGVDDLLSHGNSGQRPRNR